MIYLKLTDALELSAVVSAGAPEPAGGVITHPQVALLLRQICTDTNTGGGLKAEADGRQVHQSRQSHLRHLRE